MKNKNLFLVLFVVIAASVALMGCEKEKEESLVEENGLSRDINDFISQDILDILDSLDMPIYTGQNPPELKGKYLVSPYILLSSNVENDQIGKTFSDLTLTLTEQNNEDLTITLSVSQGKQEGEAIGGYIVGNENNFSVFAKITMHINDRDSCLMTRIFSGVISEEGIADYYSCLVMLDDYGDPNDIFIANGAARVFYDEDFLAERTEGNMSVLIKENENLNLPNNLSDSKY